MPIFNSTSEYINYIDLLFNNTEFKKHVENTKQSYYTYRHFIIDVKFDVDEEDETCVSDTFEPFYEPQKNVYYGKTERIHYERPLILLDYKNDIIKYKNEIIKYIDYDLYNNDELTAEEIQNEMKKYDELYNKSLSKYIHYMKKKARLFKSTVELDIGITLINENNFNCYIDLIAKLLRKPCYIDGIGIGRIPISKYTLQDIINLKIGGELITDLKEYNLIFSSKNKQQFLKLMDKYDFKPFALYPTSKKFEGHVLDLPFEIYKTELIDLIKNVCVFNNTIVKYNKPQEIYKGIKTHGMKSELTYIDRIILNNMPEHNVIIEFNYEQAEKDIENIMRSICDKIPV